MSVSSTMLEGCRASVEAQIGLPGTCVGWRSVNGAVQSFLLCAKFGEMIIRHLWSERCTHMMLLIYDYI